ncbi:RND superfamily putative drug exporter [Phycicoccus badiiscoriae]|uniref:RND superfamily putative drug exporter n=1 Tax=Pedococcus badiiscoriae TaxID=642776 RepID=A0A852WKP8_9MICO|nr:MMPL family transporter [Pedococcus badiiscoriae]NYG06795.1 RND superfamily putative drug exporter [Pedococcus badiiscoriae]
MRSWRKSEVGSLARMYAWLVVRLRWFVVLGWVAGGIAAAVWLPASVPNADLGGFAPPNSRAIATETASAKAFGFPVLSRTMLVQHDEHGLSQAAQQRVLDRAVAVAKHQAGDVGPMVAAVPIINTQRVFPSSSEQGTTALTYIFTKPGTTFGAEVEAAKGFGRRQMNQADDHLVGVTGTVPAQLAQSSILYGHLLLLEGATLVVVIGIVALKFRSFVAPLVALVTAAASYFLAVRVTNYAGRFVQGGAPEELKPLVLALVLGIVTDYAIFYLSSMRTGLQEGMDRLTAAKASAAHTGRIVLVAGIAVAAGSAAMLVARSGFFRAFGPVLSLSVLCAVVVSLTLLPALMAIFGRMLFWPSRPRRPWSLPLARAAARVLTVRVVALVLGGACVVGLATLAIDADRLKLGVSFVASLPADSAPHAAAQAATSGFAPGIVAPTEVLLQGNGVGSDQQKLTRLASELQHQPGVAGVLSPAALPPEVVSGALVTKSGDAARFLVVLDHDPLGPTAIGDLDRLSHRMPALLQQAGLTGARYGVAGDTAIASELVAATNADLRRIAIAVLLVNLVLLMVFLRAVVAPVLLLGCSVLALAASLGCLTLVFQDRLGHEGVAFYVPFAASVLLLSLGSDYNIYGVGHVWTRANHTTLRKAIAERIPETSGAITAAGVTLAASFGMLALIPLRQFRELAFVMGLGVLIDALVVRSILVPALLTLLGDFSAWPRKLKGAAVAEAAEQDERADQPSS